VAESGGEKITLKGAQRPRPAEPEKKKLCILGTASSMKEAPFEDDSFEMWGVSGLLGSADCKRLDRVYELHPWWEMRSMLQLLMELEKTTVPVYMQEVKDEVPTSVKFPHDEVKEMFYLSIMNGPLYATNTITWMILHGIYEGYKDFSLFGVHMAHDMEYAYQRSSCSWALGIIHGYMIQGLPYSLHIPEESELLQAEYEYAFDQPTKLMMEIAVRKTRLGMGIQQTEQEMKKLEQQRWKTEGAHQECTYWQNVVNGYK